MTKDTLKLCGRSRITPMHLDALKRPPSLFHGFFLQRLPVQTLLDARTHQCQLQERPWRVHYTGNQYYIMGTKSALPYHAMVILLPASCLLMNSFSVLSQLLNSSLVTTWQAMQLRYLELGRVFFQTWFLPQLVGAKECLKKKHILHTKRFLCYDHW